jgi:hypothetical protein
MNNPIVSWLAYDLSVLPKMQFNNGVVDGSVLADTDSDEVEFYIANNFTNAIAAGTAVFDMKNVVITTKSNDVVGGNVGTMDEQLVQEQWVKVKLFSDPPANYQGIGASTSDGGVTWDEVSFSLADISGAANNGDPVASAANLAHLSAYAHPSLNATAGKHNYLLRVVYSYGS